MNLFDKIKNFFLNRKAKRLEEKIQTDEGYVTKVMSIDNVALADLFEKSLPPKMLTLINQIRRSIYNDPLSTKVSDEKLIEITRAFFATIDDEFSERVNGILDKKDGRFVLRIDPSFNGENRVSSAKYPIEISVTKYGDLRDVYELVHELTHCLDIDRGETDTKRILGEVAPQCMERLLDGYLIENCDALGFNIDDLREDIEIRKITTFISRIKNAIEFNKKQRERIYGEIDSRYMLAQLYQTELMKNDQL